MNVKQILSLALAAGTLSAAPLASAKAPVQHGKAKASRPAAQKADGSSMARAVKIHENDTERGIAAENAWIAEHLPQYRKTGQALLQDKSGIYDRITVRSAAGDTREIYFEISEFFGRRDGKPIF